MPVFKCKMCGGTIEVNGNETVGVCEYCGSKQTLPRLDDDKKANLYDRADHYRRNNDYDKAMGIYEQILNEDKTDAEAYWSLVLCRYGIEYVEDPSTHKRIPTINRAQFTSVLADEDYKSALKYADISQKIIYEQEAKTIDDIQKGILQISSKEDPFDVFICYKETDNNGRRTQDSVLATDLYHQLTQEGLKVFFSRITLEDKLGTAYEPYIFAALNSAKVMVVLGTRPEYFNAVWVKNEWSRYLSLVKKSNGKKVLIPAYRDMDPYDLPEEFSHLQAQDMSKLGFMQDLIRGIKKISNVDNNKTSVVKETVVNNVHTNSNDNVSPLLERAFMFLEDGNWQEADAYCERVLDQEPKNGKAYICKLMAELKVATQKDLAKLDYSFESNNNFKKAIRFSDDELKNTMNSILDSVKANIEEKRIASLYEHGLKLMNTSDNEKSIREAVSIFESISTYKDADDLKKQCLAKVEYFKKMPIYNKAMLEMKTNPYSIKSYKQAIDIFQQISGWKDVDEQIQLCQQKIEELEEKKKREEYKKKENKKKIRKASIIVACCILLLLLCKVVIRNIKISRQIENIKSVDVGQTIKFGFYEQDGNRSNGKEEIEWIVLAKEDDKILVISKYALDCKPYNNEYTNITWEDSSIRKWLNGIFINKAFSLKAKNFIQETTLVNDSYPFNSTKDKIFLLSNEEAETYFSSRDERKCELTQYAKDEGGKPSFEYCLWWLRTNGIYLDSASYVNASGGIVSRGSRIDEQDRCVRPALWIKVKS